MYRIVYTKQAVKDIKNLKSVHLDEKAKKLIAKRDLHQEKIGEIDNSLSNKYSAQIGISSV